jgi:hypothetical protein
MLIIVLIIFLSGCTQSSGTVPAAPGVPVTTLLTPENAPLHQDSLLKDIKDSSHLFSLQVPEGWNVYTYRLKNADSPEGLMYRTDLVEENVFYIDTYTASRSPDPAYSDQFRNWSPAPTETIAKINGITYDRFESASRKKTSVAYVARKSSANERGYASVIVFTANTTKGFEKEDFEKIVTSFRYFSGSNASSMPGEEITLTNAPFKPSSGCSCNCGCGS